jgi:subtilase family serine protease
MVLISKRSRFILSKSMYGTSNERTKNLQSENQSSRCLSVASHGDNPGKCYTLTYFQGYEYQSSMCGETYGQTSEREYIENGSVPMYNMYLLTEASSIP